MTAAPEGDGGPGRRGMRAQWRRLTAAWRRRLLWATAAWLVLVAGATLAGLSPSVPLSVAALAAGLAVLAVAEVDSDQGLRTWYAGDLTGTALGRGSDHATTALGDHLALIQRSPETSGELIARVHARVCALLEAAVWREQHVDLRANAEWAASLLPPDLAAFYRNPPDPDTLHPQALDRLLTRIEQL